MQKGIYCLEAFWFGRHDKTSVRPILDLLDHCQGIKHYYHRCATKEELTYMIDQWGQKGFQKKYPIIYFATHGEPNLLDFGTKSKIQLEEIATILEGKCERAVFYFGSCETLKLNAAYIKNFLQKTKGLAAIGYKIKVDWLLSASMDILTLNYLQKNPFSSIGIQKTENEIKEDIGKLAKGLDFRIVLNRDHFATKRVK